MTTVLRGSTSRRPRLPAARAAAAVATVLVAAVGCSSDDGGQAAPGAPLVVATTSIWADVVSNVACDGLVEVETIVPAGSDPHGFEPSLRDRDTMSQAALVVSNGLALEEGLDDTLDEVAADGTAVFAVADQVDTIPFSAGGEHDDDGHDDDGHDDDGHDEADDGHDEAGEHDGHDHEGDDPHIWFDPIRVSGALDDLADALVSEAGLDEAAVAACLATYQEQLAQVDADIEDLVAGLREDQRLLVTNHDALGYFADRYGFEIIGTVIPAGTSNAETNPAQLTELAELIEQTGVPAVFADAQVSEGDAQALADEVGASLVVLNTGSLGPEGSGADTYVGLLRTDASTIVDALGGSAR